MYELITPPAVEPFTLADLKEAMRIDQSDDDSLVMRLGRTARRMVERRLSHAIADQTWQLTVSSHLPEAVHLRPSDVRTVTSVHASYGETPEVASSDWLLSKGRPARLDLTVPASNGSEQLTQCRIVYQAGRTDVSTTPPDLVQAIIMLAAHYYENREAVASGRYVPMPQSVEALLDGFREVAI